MKTPVFIEDLCFSHGVPSNFLIIWYSHKGIVISILQARISTHTLFHGLKIRQPGKPEAPSQLPEFSASHQPTSALLKPCGCGCDGEDCGGGGDVCSCSKFASVGRRTKLPSAIVPDLLL